MRRALFINPSAVPAWHKIERPPLPTGPGSVPSIVHSVHTLFMWWLAFTQVLSSQTTFDRTVLKIFWRNILLFVTTSLVSERSFLPLILLFSNPRLCPDSRGMGVTGKHLTTLQWKWSNCTRYSVDQHIGFQLSPPLSELWASYEITPLDHYVTKILKSY